MVCVLTLGLSGPDSIPGQGHFVVFLVEILPVTLCY